MKYEIDTEKGLITATNGADVEEYDLYSSKGFQKISDLWVQVGWNQKHCYTFSWMGRPVIQLPDDMIRMQEVIWDVKPDVVLETGVAHGGSLIFYAGLLKAIGKGRVIGVDIEIRPHNREAIEAHPMFDRIELVEGNAVSKEIVEQVTAMTGPDETVLVILDSDHTYDHVAKELEAYSSLVSVGSYIVATDGIGPLLMDTPRLLSEVPRGERDWDKDNPTEAAKDFVKNNDGFEIVDPPWMFNESDLQAQDMPTHWPGAWIKRVR